jgi:hypothetical protein
MGIRKPGKVEAVEGKCPGKGAKIDAIDCGQCNPKPNFLPCKKGIGPILLMSFLS